MSDYYRKNPWDQPFVRARDYVPGPESKCTAPVRMRMYPMGDGRWGFAVNGSSKIHGPYKSKIDASIAGAHFFGFSGKDMDWEPVAGGFHRWRDSPEVAND